MASAANLLLSLPSNYLKNRKSAQNQSSYQSNKTTDQQNQKSVQNKFKIPENPHCQPKDSYIQPKNRSTLRNNLTGHFIVDLEARNPAIVDQILKNLPISDLLSLRLSHPKCEPIIFRQYQLDKTRFGHYLDNLSLYAKIKYRTYAFYDQSIQVLETRHPGKFKLQEQAEKNLSNRMKRLKLGQEDDEVISNSSSDRDSGIDVNDQLLKKRAYEKERDSRSIFVGNIDYKSEQKDLQMHFEKFCGPVNRVTFLKDFESRQFKGYAFVEFRESHSVHIAVQMDGLQYTKKSDRELRIRCKRTNMPGMQRVIN